MISLQRRSKGIVLSLGFILAIIYNGCGEGPFRAGGVKEASSQNDGSTGENPSSVSDPTVPNPPGTGEEPGEPPVVVTPDPTNPDPMPDPTPDPMPNPPAGRGGPALLAVGHFRSTMYSCDGGRTWEGYRSLNNNRRCFDQNSGNIDCDHAPGSAKGVTYGDHGFLATYGWGTPGHVEISEDGDNWETVHSGATFAGVAFGNGHYFLNDRFNGQFSNNGGETWRRSGRIETVPYNLRQAYFVPHSGGTFISTANSGGVHDLMISRNEGQSFAHPQTLPQGCGQGELAFDDNMIVLMSAQLCVSADGGNTWVTANKPRGTEGLIHDGTEFKTYSAGNVHRSTNGIDWRTTPIRVNGANANLDFENVAYQKDLGRYAAIIQGWGGWYERTQYYHSDDGINWTRVNKQGGDAPASPHPIRAIASGYLKSCN